MLHDAYGGATESSRQHRRHMLAGTICLAATEVVTTLASRDYAVGELCKQGDGIDSMHALLD